MRFVRLFTDHPASLGETYSQHCGVALNYAGPLALAAMAAVVHAVLPFLFKSTASKTIGELNARMSKRCSSCALGPVHRPDLFVAPLEGVAAK